MNPNAPSSSPGASPGGKAMHQDWKMKSRPDLLCPKPLPPAKHLLPPNQPWAAQNQKSVFDGGMTANAQDEPRRMRHLPEKEWANQSYKSDFKAGEGTDAGPEKTPDPHVPWANAEKQSHMGFVDGTLSTAEGPVSYGHPSTMGATENQGRRVNKEMRAMMQKSYYKGAGMAPPPPVMEKREMDPEALGEPALQQKLLWERDGAPRRGSQAQAPQARRTAVGGRQGTRAPRGCPSDAWEGFAGTANESLIANLFQRLE